MSSELRTEVFPANGQIVVADTANFLMLIQTAAAVTVRLQGASGNYAAAGVQAGYVKGNVRPWDRATIVGTAGASVQFFIGLEDINEDFTDYRRTVGIFQQQQPATLVDYADVDVGASGSAILVLPANAARFKGTVKNNDASAIAIRVGTAATVAAGRGIELAPGQSKTYQVPVAIYAIRTSAAAATVSCDDENL